MQPIETIALSTQMEQYAIVESICDPQWPNPKKIPTKGFIVLSDSLGHGEFQKQSLHKSDSGKGVNLHIFKMAANETNNVLLTVYGWFYTL